MSQGFTTRRALVIGTVVASGLAAAEALRPHHRLASELPPIQLAQAIPTQFGHWQEDRSVQPLLPDPNLQAKLDMLYSDLLARTYRNAAGRQIMLSIAYGSDQGSEATAVHRPEFCYSAQGFRVLEDGLATLPLPGRQIMVQRLIATSGPRYEPILYWVTLADHATLPGLGRKWAQIRYGMRGEIPDGMLVRTSTVGLAAEPSFALQIEFLQQLNTALPPTLARRVFGI